MSQYQIVRYKNKKQQFFDVTTKSWRNATAKSSGNFKASTLNDARSFLLFARMGSDTYRSDRVTMPKLLVQV